MNAQAAILLSRRSDFTGRTDKYASVSPVSNKFGSINDAVNGFGPFDVTRALFDERMREMAVNRLERYRTNWRFFRGEHHNIPLYDGEKKPVFNFCETVINKAVEYFTGRGWCTVMPKGNELVGQALDMVWESNDKMLLTQMIAQYSTTSGDAFVYVTVLTSDASGNVLPQNQWRVSLFALNPNFCFPVFDKAGNIARILIQYPRTGDPLNNSLYSLVITPTTFQTFQDDAPLTPPIPNPFGCVNVVNFRNLPLASSNYGTSDIEHVIPLNESYNRVAFSMERIIRYHAEPTTIIKGAKASSLEKGANKVWSGIPIDGDVANLELKGDLAAIREYLKLLRSQILEQASTPEVCVDGSKLPHSNTPGIALELMFKPLLDKTARRWQGFERAMRNVNNLVVIAHRVILKAPLESLADFPDKIGLSKVKSFGNMPRDEKSELEIAKAKKDLGVISEAQLQRQFATVDADPERLALEIAADRMQDLSTAMEMARAEMGIPPNLGSVFLSSSYLNEDLGDVAAKISALDKSNPPELVTAN